MQQLSGSDVSEPLSAHNVTNSLRRHSLAANMQYVHAIHFTTDLVAVVTTTSSQSTHSMYRHARVCVCVVVPSLTQRTWTLTMWLTSAENIRQTSRVWVPSTDRSCTILITTKTTWWICLLSLSLKRLICHCLIAFKANLWQLFCVFFYCVCY